MGRFKMQEYLLHKDNAGFRGAIRDTTKRISICLTLKRFGRSLNKS